MSILIAVPLLLAPVTDPELLRKLNEPPPGYVLDPPPCPDGKPTCKPWERYQRPTEPPLPRGPHTLVVSDGQGMTRMDYSSGEACKKARDQVRLQTDSRLTNRNPNIIYGSPRVTAFCVPR